MNSSPPTSSAISGLALPAVLGAVGSSLVALASNLPGSPFGAHAAGAWPFAAAGPAPGGEGPRAPLWAQPVDLNAGVPHGGLLVIVLAVLGVVLLSLGWFRLWSVVRADPGLNLRAWWWVGAIWTVPLLFSAPFASQDVWVYGAQGKVIASGFGASTSVSVLGHSPWLHGVDPKYLTGPSIYGPGALGLSALFAALSGSHPWVSVELWRLTIIASLGLCAWGVHRVVSARGGGGAASAVVAVVLNPAVLVIFVASIHNDAVMIALVVAAIALAVTGRPKLGLAVAALAVSVKAPALLAVLAIGWWAWPSTDWRDRCRRLAMGSALTVAALFVLGLFVGGGFAWVKSASAGRITSTFSFTGEFVSYNAEHLASAVQLVAILAAVGLIVLARRRDVWILSLALGLALMAVGAVNPQPWYLLWALPALALSKMDDQWQRTAIVALTFTVVWSEMPLGAPAWFGGAAAIVLVARFCRGNGRVGCIY